MKSKIECCGCFKPLGGPRACGNHWKCVQLCSCKICCKFVAGAYVLYPNYFCKNVKTIENHWKYDSFSICRPSVVGVRRPSPVVVVRRPFRRRRRPLSCPASVRRPSRRRRRPLSVRPVRPSSSSVVVRRPTVSGA